MAIPGTASQSSAQDPLRITTYSPQSYGAVRGTQNSSTPSPKTSTGVPNDNSRWGGRYNSAQLKDQERKPSLPVCLFPLLLPKLLLRVWREESETLI